jgi:probable HAF family extracellular repeat protein
MMHPCFSKAIMKTLVWARCFKRDMLIVGSISLLLLSAAKGQSRYTITDIGALEPFSYAKAINNRGQVVGFAYTNSGSSSIPHAFLYSGGQMLDLGTLSGFGNSVAQGSTTMGRSSALARTAPFLTPFSTATEKCMISAPWTDFPPRLWA